MKQAQTIAVVGGSGIYQLDLNIKNEHEIETPFGNPSDVIIEFELDGSSFYFLPRHGKGHRVLPHEINYRANIYALKKLGVDAIVSASAVGSLREDYAPGDFVLVDQFIDWTKGKRERTFFGSGVIGHVSVANPVETALTDLIQKASSGVDCKVHRGGTYICIEGPQFSSKAESHMYRSFGASVIGMTNVPEAYLAKEAGIAYATIAMVTDYDCWKEEHCTVDEIMKVMHANTGNANELVKNVIKAFTEKGLSYQPENNIGIMTPRDQILGINAEIIDTLTK